MTPHDYIDKAKYALATDQPNLAMIYMNRGIEILDKRKAVHPYEMMALAFKQMGMGFDRVAIHIQQAFGGFHQVIADMREANRAAN